MRKTKALVLMVTILLFGYSIGASAADPANVLSQRIENQQQRIDAGIAKRQLTRQEADMVQDNLNWIRDTYARMKRDRVLTGEEIRKLDAMLDRNSRMITKETKDFQRVYQDNIEARIVNQQRRIDAGIAKRQLTRQEADMVLDNLNWIRDTYARMKRDRVLTDEETRKLTGMLDQNSRMIARETTDFQRVYPGNFEARIKSQQQRIDAGIAKGQLTRHEAETVQDNLNWIRDTFAKMKRDGRLTPREQKKLDEMLDRNNQLIYKTRNDFDRFRNMRDITDFFR